MSASRIALIFALLALACSKENRVNVNQNTDPDASHGTLGLGDACAASSECQSGLTCLFQICRTACQADVECGGDSLCLSDGAENGCRLPDERSCTTTSDCANALLACGLDDTCRIACSANQSCPRSDQVCISGACVSTTEANYQTTFGTCDPKDAGNVLCEGAKLWSCDLKSPGKLEYGTCATDALCQQAATSGSTKCPVCGPSGITARCAGTTVEVCAADFSGFDVTECAPEQCNPKAGTCFSLDIDAHEVTRAEYAAAEPTLAPGEGACAYKQSATDYAPDAACMSNAKVCSTGCEEHPQVCVDWCDAAAYCAAKGRRLCGRIGGGVVAKDLYDDPSTSQWMNACSSGGQYAFTFGAWGPGSGQVCNGALVSSTTVPVGSLPKCHSPISTYAATFDLTGNVAEWEDACDNPAPSGGATDGCHARGGSFEQSSQTDLDCVADRLLPRNTRLPDVGFRCCGP